MRTILQGLADIVSRNTSVQIQTAARNYLRTMRRRRTGRIRITTMSFILNFFDAMLDLNKSEDYKLFKTAMLGLDKEQKFNGKRENFADFCKLIQHKLDDTRLYEVLDIATEWIKAVSTNAIMVVNVFDKTRIKISKVKEHFELVWADTQHKSVADKTSKYFKNFGTTKPADDVGLNLARNTRRFKHVMC